MEVKPGYKQTEVGLIPEEWDLSLLGDCCALITKGTTPTSLGKKFVKSGVHFLKAESISEAGTTIREKVAFIDDATHALLKRSQLTSGDLLISIAGVLGRIGLVRESDVPANTNQALAIVRLGNRSALDRTYLFYNLRSPFIAKQIRDINVQAAQANISLQNVRDFRIPHPSIVEEQRAIVEALSDVDGLLSGLDRLIAKKHDLKQAAMQQLLTGKTRLPGFHDKWEVKTFGELFKFSGG
ncbi:MAG: restriction endonuclease subunit S, partial [Bdellovibrionales bacterium]|nr:restriction endonuclease subunit S [Bdellovibrionales bacterium]